MLHSPSSKMASLSLDEVLQRYGLKEEHLNISCSLEQRSEIAEAIVNWKDLAPAIGLDEKDVITIKSDHQDYRSQCSAALTRWEEIKGKEATYLSLAKALTAKRNASCVEKLCEIFKKYYAPDKPQTSSEYCIYVPPAVSLPGQCIFTVVYSEGGA